MIQADTVIFLAIILGTVAAVATTCVALAKKNTDNIGEFGNGVLGLTSMIAVVAGSWLYYFEGRGHPRVNVSASATVVGLPTPGWQGLNHPLRNVLVQISVVIENRGERARGFNCAALDIIGLTGTEHRVMPYTDDLTGPSLLAIDPHAPADPVWVNCVGPGNFEDGRNVRAREHQQKHRGDADVVNPPVISGPPQSGARYRDFFMEPGERTTKTWEQLVPCTFSAVRVIFKLPKPDGTADYETKILIPIVDICRGLRLVAHYPGDRD